MKKTYTILLCLSVLSFSLHGNGTDFLPLASIDGSWMSKGIPMNSSDETADVMTLLKAFHTAWPTEVVQALISEAGDNRFVESDVTDCENRTGHVFVDCDDFNYASFEKGEPASQRVDAMVYECENGHLLFGICFEDHGIDEMTFCCFYDYNPYIRLMTPEEAPYVALKRKWKDSQFRYYLGMEYDPTFIVQETSPEGEVWYHHFFFDGMKHVYHHSGEDFYDFEESDDLDLDE